MKDCNQCGKCCLLYANGGLSASAAEIEYWESHRPDIAAYVSGGEIWLDPDTGEPLLSCPWLEKAPGQEKYTCQIYFDRPDDCRYYPVLVEEMIRDGCEMLQPRDLKNLRKAQRDLDKLMADSRPPMES
ncbi:MAG: YkgJ family cysteine cluster protein [Woeseiaceae bacterium]